MGRSRYFCHHCGVSFPYTREARRQHFSGVQHTDRARQHYQQHETPQQRYQRHRDMKPCRDFARRGECNFGDRCKYLHKTQREMEMLRLQAEHAAMVEEYGPPPCLPPPGGDAAAVAHFLSVTLPRERLRSLFAASILDDDEVPLGCLGPVAPPLDSSGPHNNNNNLSGPHNNNNLSVPPPTTAWAASASGDNLTDKQPTTSSYSTLPPSLRKYKINTILGK